MVDDRTIKCCLIRALSTVNEKKIKNCSLYFATKGIPLAMNGMMLKSPGISPFGFSLESVHLQSKGSIHTPF